MPVIYTSQNDNAVFGKEFLEEILAWIANRFQPEDVFTEAQLREWALENDFTEE